MPLKIDYKKCCWKDGKCASCCCGSKSGACVGCVEACPVSALRREKVLVLDASKCVECGACVDACKHKALTLSA